MTIITFLLASDLNLPVGHLASDIFYLSSMNLT